MYIFNLQVARLFQSHATFADLFGHDKIDIAYKPAVSTEQLGVSVCVCVCVCVCGVCVCVCVYI